MEEVDQKGVQTNKNKHPLNSQGQPHGTWECYHSNGQLNYKGNFINVNKDGIWFEDWENDKFTFHFNI